MRKFCFDSSQYAVRRGPCFASVRSFSENECFCLPVRETNPNP
jgi:hypothetical protein